MDTRIWTHSRRRRLVVPALLVALLLGVAAGAAAARGSQSAPAPTIASVSPATAPNTGLVTLGIKGSGFDTRARLATTLVLGTTVITGEGRATRDTLASAHFDLTGAPVGAYDVVLANPDGQQARLVAAFTVTAGAQPKPVITKLKPASGKRKATVTITGTGFGAARISASCLVKFGSKKCVTYASWSATTIKCKVPAKAAFGRAKVVVTTAAGTSNSKNFMVKK